MTKIIFLIKGLSGKIVVIFRGDVIGKIAKIWIIGIIEKKERQEWFETIGVIDCTI